jgi:hypothetical protein
MLPDALPQLFDTLLRLPLLEAAQLRELIQHLPDPQAAAQEMVRRGWVTQTQFSSLFPDPQQRPTSRETVLHDFGDDALPPDVDGDNWNLLVSDDEERPDADCDDWILLVNDDEDKADVAPLHSGAASTPQFEWKMLAPAVAGGNATRRLPRQGMGWASWARKGLLMATLFLGGLFVGLQGFGAKSTAPPVARQESRQANAADLARAVDLPPVPPMVPINNTKQRADLPTGTGQNARPAAPVAVPPAAPVAAEAPVRAEAPARANEPKPKSKPSLYARVRQVVRENKTEETERLGIGDFAYQDVPDDGSIMVGMEVTYASALTHQMIRSVRPIYQKPDGQRYDGPVCGNPTRVSERVVAREGFAIGGAAIKAGTGIDGMQLTFMEIGADGLNPKKTYLSKWLGGHGGSGARTFVNDGRPIVGIAGMRSIDPHSRAFCMCLVTTQAEASADADGTCDNTSSSNNAKQNDVNQFRVGQAVLVEWGGRWWDARVLKEENGQYYVTYSGYASGFDEWVGPARIQQIMETQEQIMETARQNMQRAQPLQQKVRQEMMQTQQQIRQTQQQIMQRHQAIRQRHQQQIMRARRR